VHEKISPGKDSLLPEILLSFWADAGNMNKGVLEQNCFPLLAYHAKAPDVMVRVAMSGIDVCNFQRQQFLKGAPNCSRVAAETI
jgi:hypothetical protein